MPIITPDFTEAVENEPVPAGVYKARITDCTPKTSKAGNAMLDWKLSIFGAEGDYMKQNNRAVFMNTMLTGKGAFRLKELAKAALGELPATNQWDTDELLGKEIEITVATRMQEDGSVSNFPEVKAVKSLRA